MKSMGCGFGKIIFFGEHFVVHGSFAIACPLSQKTCVEIQKSDFLKIISDKDVPCDVLDLQKQLIEKLLSLLRISDNKFSISIISELISSAGMGYSASLCVATARALSDYFKLNLCDEKINELAFEGEKIFHGNPSGVDNTVSTFGKSILFKKDDFVVIQNLKIKKSLNIVVVFSGETGNTKTAVEKVNKFKELNDKSWSDLFVEECEIVTQAKMVFELGDLEKIGLLMNCNHELLQKIGVSTQKLDILVNIALQNRALGAKITGSGLGGCIIVLAKNSEQQNNICLEFKKLGYCSFTTNIEKTL